MNTSSSLFGGRATKSHVLAALMIVLGLLPVHAAEPVRVTVVKTAHPMVTAPYCDEGLRAMYPAKPDAEIKAQEARIKGRQNAIKAERNAAGADVGKEALAGAYAADPELVAARAELARLGTSLQKTIEHEYELVTLNNGLVEVKIAPSLGMRILNAIDLATGQSLFGPQTPRDMETQPFSDIIAWTAGHVEASFPYFEHGMGVRQGAGHRIVRRDDGGVTVAMTCFFTQHQESRHMGRYGRYSQRNLSVWVTLLPNEKRVRADYRLDNPTGLRSSGRLWINVLTWFQGYDEEHILYPVGYVIPHGGQSVSPFFADGGERAYVSVSHFGLYPDYDFCGSYRSDTDTSHLIITSGIGMKLYTRSEPGGGFGEIWTGTTAVFEDPGPFLPAFVPSQFHVYFWNVSGAGRVVFANEDVAVSRTQDAYYLTLSRPADVSCAIRFPDGEGNTNVTVAAGAGQPVKLVARTDPARFEVVVDGRTTEFALPLAHSDTRAKLEAIKPLGEPCRLELEEISNHIGAPVAGDAMREARKLLESGSLADAVRVQSLANACHRWGHFDLALRLLEHAGDTADAAYLRGLIALEQGKDADFAKAGPQAGYMRALQAIAAGDTNAAAAAVDAHLAAVPDAWRPRLLRAYLKRNAAAIRACLDENPASVEALWVAREVGGEDADAGLKSLLKDNPDADSHLARFVAEATQGRWTPIRRYKPLLPEDAPSTLADPIKE